MCQFDSWNRNGFCITRLLTAAIYRFAESTIEGGPSLLRREQRTRRQEVAQFSSGDGLRVVEANRDGASCPAAGKLKKARTS